MENKPEILYRGIKIDYNKLQTFKFDGIDLVVNYPPIIDKYGRKTVTDGNEYGVYMSDNLSMVEAAYGNLHRDGIPVSNLSVNYERIMIPSIGVIYQINTSGIDVREPFISDQLKGHYNNGYQGKEWITDVVPSNNYSLYRVRIGSDILHEQQDIDLSKIDDISKYLKEELEMRKYRLQVFASALEQMPTNKRSMIGPEQLSFLKFIYGKNGLKYINEESLITTNVDGMLTYLMAKSFKQNESNIDFQTLKYISNLKGQAADINSIVETIKKDKITNMQNKVAFEQRKKQEGVPFSTSSFDNHEKSLDNLMSLILIRKRKDNQQIQEKNSHISHFDSERKFKPIQKEESKKEEQKEIPEIYSEEWMRLIREKYGAFSQEELDKLIEQQEIMERQRQEMENIENVEYTGRKMR